MRVDVRFGRLIVVYFTLLLALVGCGDAPATAPAEDTSDGSRPQIERIRVSSSALASVGYDGDRRILQIEFHNGDVYQYFDVPQAVYDGLMQADSHGRYFHQHVRNAGYRYARLSE